jgi:hypothetical protein
MLVILKFCLKETIEGCRCEFSFMISEKLRGKHDETSGRTQ